MNDETREDLAWLAGELSVLRHELGPGSNQALYLALDQGGSSSRAILFDAVGSEVARAQVPIATHRDGDRVEHDPEELVASLRHAAHEACASPRAAGRTVVAAGLATQRSTICCWDAADGTPLSPAISWQDRRHARWLETELGERAGWIRELTGLPLSPHYGASKLRWCLDELPAVRLALRDERLAMGPLASFLLHRLCRERPALADPANASRTLLYDPALLDWSEPLLEAFSVPRAALPRCVGTRHAFGTLDVGVPLVACSGDQSAALYSSGRPATTTAYVNIGTGAFVQRVVRDGATHLPRGMLRSVVFADTDQVDGATWAHEGTVNGAWAAVEWLRDRTQRDPMPALADVPATPAASDRGLLFVNGVGGLGSPWWQPRFETCFVDATGRAAAHGGFLEELAAVIDSVAFLVATNVALLQRAAPLRKLVVTGGLARIDRLCRVLADATGLRVECPATHEATARGIAFLAAGEPVDWQPAPMDRLFEPRDDDVVLQHFARWREVMALRGAS